MASINVGDGLGFHGDFSSWSEAASFAERSAPVAPRDVAEKTSSLLGKLKRREIAFIRDGVPFDKAECPLALLAFLLRALQDNNGVLRLVDFGGAFGTTYFQTREFLNEASQVRWSVVELPDVVERARNELESEELNFHCSLGEALKSNPNIVLLSGVVQYLPDPDAVFRKIRTSTTEYVLFDRSPMIEAPTSRIAIHSFRGSGGRKKSWPVRLFVRTDLINAFAPQFELLAEFESYCDPSAAVDGLPIDYCGFAFKRRAAR